MPRTALVTGASSGIGLQISRQLAGRGFTIIGVGASDRVEDLPQNLPGTTVHPIRLDLIADGAIDDLWDRVTQIAPDLDVAVLNAGASLGGGFLETSIDDELSMIALNITSQVLLAKHVARAMATRGSGRILVMASLSATTPTPFESIYGPTRAFMLSFAHGLREELREHGVSVTAVLPGPTATEFHQRAGMTDTKFGSNDWKNDPEDVARQAVDALFAGRDHIVAGDRATKWAALQNMVLPERVKAHRFAKDSRPR